MNSFEQRKIEEFSSYPEFWEHFVGLGFGQLAAFAAMVLTNRGRRDKRKKALINDLYRFAKAYKLMGYSHLNK
jgi:hypothetical protein